MRAIRYVPPGGALVEVTCRTIHERLLLRPEPRLNEIVVGVLARAKRRYAPELCGAAFLSNHFHLLLFVRDAVQLASFMRYVNSNLAREITRLTDWRHKVWAQRYRAIVVSEEPAAQIERLRYVLAHGVKENLVARVRDWPGVHCAEALTKGQDLQGRWFDRSEAWAARNRGERLDIHAHAECETLSFDPLPCWRDCSHQARKRLVAELVAEVEQEAAEMRQRRGVEPLGIAAIRRQLPTEEPLRSKRSSAPTVHAATKRVRDRMRRTLAAVVSSFLEASKRFRSGDRLVLFPPGTFPPALPCQHASSISRPP